MDITYIFVAFLYFAATISCEEIQKHESNVAIVENSTETNSLLTKIVYKPTNPNGFVQANGLEEANNNLTALENSTEVTATEAKTVQKRNSLLPSNPDGSVQENGIGFKSIFIQVIAAVIKGLLNAQGITTNTINAAVNFFSPDKILNDLNLFRRFLNLTLRLISVLMSVVPTSSSGLVFNPLEKLSSKVSFYTVEPVADSAQIITFNGSKPMLSAYVPQRVQNLIDIVTKVPEASSTTQQTTEAATEVSPITQSSNEYQPPPETTTTSTRFSDELNVNVGVGGEFVSVSNAYRVPSTSSTTTTTAPPENKTISEIYGVPILVDTRNGGQDNQPNSTESKQKPNEDYGLPAPQEGNVIFRTHPHEKYGSPVNKDAQLSVWRRDKTGLPFQDVNEVFAGLPHFGRGSRFLDNAIDPEVGDFARKSTKKGDLDTYDTIADLPLEQASAFDKKDGMLRDSFGRPIPPHV